MSDIRLRNQQHTLTYWSAVYTHWQGTRLRLPLALHRMEVGAWSGPHARVHFQYSDHSQNNLQTSAPLEAITVYPSPETPLAARTETTDVTLITVVVATCTCAISTARTAYAIPHNHKTQDRPPGPRPNHRLRSLTARLLKTIKTRPGPRAVSHICAQCMQHGSICHVCKPTAPSHADAAADHAAYAHCHSALKEDGH